MKLEEPEQQVFIPEKDESLYRQVLNSMRTGLQDASTISAFANTSESFLESAINNINSYKLQKNIEQAHTLLASPLDITNETLYSQKADEISKYIPKNLEAEAVQPILELQQKLYDTSNNLKILREQNIGSPQEDELKTRNFQFDDALHYTYNNSKIMSNPDFAKEENDSIQTVFNASKAVKTLNMLKNVSTSIERNKLLNKTVKQIKQLYRDKRIPYSIRAKMFMELYKYGVENGS